MVDRTCSVSLCDQTYYARGLCLDHYQRLKTYGRLELLTPADRFWAKVKKTDSCWEWIGSRTFWEYGEIRLAGYCFPAHRVAYEWLVGPIPPGLILDHLCRVRHCVNPDHLEPVTFKENVLRGESACARNARKTHCVRGHLFDAENTRFIMEKRGKNPSPARRCKTCEKANRAARRK